MVLEEVNLSLGEFGASITSAVFERFTWLTGFVKALGIFALIYIIYLIIRAARDLRMRGRIKRIDKKVDSIEEKLDLVLNKVDNTKALPKKKKTKKK